MPEIPQTCPKTFCAANFPLQIFCTSTLTNSTLNNMKTFLLSVVKNKYLRKKVKVRLLYFYSVRLIDRSVVNKGVETSEFLCSNFQRFCPNFRLMKTFGMRLHHCNPSSHTTVSFLNTKMFIRQVAENILKRFNNVLKTLSVSWSEVIIASVKQPLIASVNQHNANIFDGNTIKI